MIGKYLQKDFFYGYPEEMKWEIIYIDYGNRDFAVRIITSPLNWIEPLPNNPEVPWEL